MHNQSLPDPEVDPEVKPSHLDFPVVGIGVSAGGFDALAKFFEAMPGHPGMAFVVILHLSPKHESSADKILQRSTSMPVFQVTESVPLEKDRVYVISPRKQLAMTDGQLRLSDLPPTRTRHVAIDYFFRTLAEVHRERAVAIVLSGTGSDGSVGISRIRELGGMTFAQLPADADYEDMPRAAIATGAVDIVLPAAEMPERVLTLCANAQRMKLPDAAADDIPVQEPPDAGARQAAEEALRDIMNALRTHTGHDFRHYKRATVLRRIERRMQVNGMETLPTYRDLLQQTPAERPALLKDMLINVTNFFRDREAFEALEREVLPEIFASRAQNEGVRAWCAGCATGEEPYSLAMLLIERAAQERAPPAIQVFATDIDGDSIAVARSAVYPSAIVTDVAPARLSRFFGKEGEHYRVSRNVREKVLFARHNVLQDPPFSKLDLVCCRNLLIYLERKVQRDVLEMFHFALRPGGYLFLGSAESVDAASEFFTPVDKKNRIFRALATRRARIHVGTPTAMLDGRSMVTPPPTRHPQASPLAEVHRRAIEQHAPPSVLVSHEGNVLHMSERAGRFLRHVGGTPSLSLLALVLPELRLELRTALYQAMQSHQSVDSRRVRIMRDRKAFYVNMTTLPVAGENPGDTYFLVLFTEVECVLSEGEKSQHDDDPVLLQLEEELKRTREQLQGTIEHSENSHEELTASNEELQSINEELRSATEELETSKEELQSINEELITVNHELKDKVEETGKINDDLQNLIASTDIATVFIDRGLCIKRYTPRATDIFSIIPADVGRSLLDITHRLDYEELAKDAIETFQSLRTTEREVGSADGRWYIVRMLPYRTTEDRIDGAVITFIDITRRRQAEEEVHQNEERLRLVADSALDFAIITMDAHGIITGWSKGAMRLFGYTEAEAIGRPGDLLFTEVDRQKNAFEGELLLARQEGSAEDDRWHLRKNGERVYCSGTVRPMLRGGLHGYVKIARDVTGERRQQRERDKLLKAEQLAREAAQAAIEMKDEFLAVMSHELKHPLNLVLMNTELLARRPDIRGDANGRRATEAIRRTVLNQAQIIDDLLDLSRLNTGKMTLRLTAVNLSDAIRRITGAVEADLVASGLTLDIALPPDDAWMEADPVRLDQVVWNLLSNAMKFTPKGGHIQIKLQTDEHNINLDVIDNGIGMDAEMLDRVFNMFEQASTRPNRHTGGLGIGLALVRQLAELQDGEVKAYSDGPGKGTRMCVHWPLKPFKGIETMPSAPSAELAGRRIVLVDDSAAVLEPFSELLGMEGADVQAFESGPAALEYVRAHPVDVLFSDIGMPGMDGYELIREIRQLPQHANLLAIALTGFGRAQDGERARDAGFDAHIGKPIMMKTLMETLRRLDAERVRR